MADFLICGIRVSPAEVLADRTREQDVFLQNAGNLIAQDCEVVLPDILATDADGSLRHIVESGDQLYEGRF